MKRWIAVCVLTGIVVLMYSITYAQCRDDSYTLNQDLCVTVIEEGVFGVTHSFPWPANSLLVDVGQDNFVLVDTPYEDTATKLLVEWIKKTFGEEIRLTVINTHFHRDNLGGNGYLLSQNIPVYGSDLTAKLLEEKKEESQKQLLEWLNKPKFQRFYDVLKDAELVAPDHIFPLKDSLQLQLGDEDIEVFYPGPAHSVDNVVVYFSSRKILFGGCMIKSLESKNLGNLADADVAEWPNSANTVLTRYPEARLVIPGHGNWGDVSLIHHTLALLEQHKK